MPKQLRARPPAGAAEERKVRKLTHSVHAPADWNFHARIVAHSWDGLRTRQIAAVLGCHPQTVRERLQAFNDRGFEGLGMKSGGGRKPRLTEQERSAILSLIHFSPPGQPTYEPTGELHVDDAQGAVEWTLDALTAMARKNGIQVARSQVRRIFRQEGVRWRQTRLWATTSKDPDFVPKGQRSSGSLPTHPRVPPSSVSTSWVP
jgi:transposase